MIRYSESSYPDTSDGKFDCILAKYLLGLNSSSDNGV